MNIPIQNDRIQWLKPGPLRQMLRPASPLPLLAFRAAGRAGRGQREPG